MALLLSLLATACSLERGPLAPSGDGGTGCTQDSECDDAIDCTRDRCVDGRCEIAPDDGRCGSGRCLPNEGCVADCDSEACAEGPLTVDTECRVGRCEGGSCGQVDVCAEMGDEYVCCGDGSCQACDDGNECTVDRCGADGCVHEPLIGVPCSDDGLFCNGSEACVADGEGARCASVDPPCPGSCQAETDSCECTVDADCEDRTGTWSACRFGADGTAESCDGIRQRQDRTSGRCIAGSCEWETRTVMDRETCRMERKNARCGDDNIRNGPCRFDESNVCGKEGTRIQTVTSPTCDGAGRCVGQASESEIACRRNTDGDACGDVEVRLQDCEYSSATACTGSRNRIETPYMCQSGSCEPGMATTTRVTTGCAALRNGTRCLDDELGACAPSLATCSTSGTRDVTRYTCNAGACDPQTLPEECPVDPSGASCDDGDACTIATACDSAGACGEGTARDCDDGVACTVDSCSGDCVNTPDDSLCEDIDGYACSVPSCTESGCEDVPNDALCNGPCRIGVCDPAAPAAEIDADGCRLAPVGESCDQDGDLCTEDECDGSGACVSAGTEVSCTPSDCGGCGSDCECRPSSGSCACSDD